MDSYSYEFGPQGRDGVTGEVLAGLLYKLSTGACRTIYPASELRRGVNGRPTARAMPDL